jgi:hypothetical protein
LFIHYPCADITYFDKLEINLNLTTKATNKFSARLILQISDQ